MKINLIICFMFLAFVSCKNEDKVLPENSHSNIIAALRSDFEKQTGYHQKDSNFLFQSFKTSINWEQNKIVSDDTIYVKVNLLDKVELFSPDARNISIRNMVWIKAIKAKDIWSYTLLTFVPENTKSGYTGAIISKSILSGDQWKAYYIAGQLVKHPNEQIIKKINSSKRASNDRECTYGIVNGEINIISCEPERSDNDDPDRGDGGEPIDYEVVDPSDEGAGGGGGGNGGDGEPTNDPDREIIDSLKGYPCAQAVLAKLPNLENKISEWLKNTFGNNVDYNITFRADPTMSDATDGTHYPGNKSGLDQYITLNGNMLQTASQEYIAVTMFHEALHGFLHMEKHRLEELKTPEQFGILYPGFGPVMINNEMKFTTNHEVYGTLLNDLRDAVISLNPNISPYDAMALAKGGIIKNINSVEQGINYAHKKGNAGTNCN